MIPETAWIEHACPNLVELIRRSNRARVHSSQASDFQVLRKPRENLAAGLGHDHHVFVPNAAEAGIIKSRLDRETLSIFQHDFLESRILVNLEPETMTGAVDESDVRAVPNLSRIAALS